MAFRRFIMAHRYTSEDGKQIVIPRGWAGELPAAIAAAADKAGVTVAPEDVPAPKPKPKD